MHPTHTTHVPAAGLTASPSAERAVLLVDDEATLRSALRRFFIRRGWRVGEAENGEQARAMLLDEAPRGGGYDAIITDMRMPVLSGMELHALVTGVDATLGRRFIFSSGDTGDADAAAYLAQAGCPVVAKPFELSALLSLVEHVAVTAAPH
jgi:DNA-binding response OmpR family regulator